MIAAVRYCSVRGSAVNSSVWFTERSDSLKKLAQFIVKKKIPILVFFSIATIVCVVLSNFVKLNYDMISYLPADSQVKKGVRLMNEQFEETTTINVMFKGLSEEEKEAIPDRIEAIGGVDSVTYDPGSEDYNNGENTLYVVSMPGNGYLKSNTDVLKALKNEFSGYEAYYNGTTVDNLALNESLSRIIVVALILLFIILILMCASFAEPVLFLAAIGMAVLINMGTNVIFSGIAQITNSIAAVLQLVLSMDYSVMLIDRYRQERKKTPDKEAAMQNALEHGFLSISSSSVTTIAGLLCLIFMSFLIGRDLGLVLAKGVFLSLVCILFVLPGLILLSDKLIAKTAKPVLHIPMGGLAKVEYKGRYVILALFAVLFLGALALKGNVTIDYYTSNYNHDAELIEAAFPADNTLVVLYDNESEAGMAEADGWVSAQAGVTGTNGYSNSLGKQLTAEELADSMGMDSSLLNILYYEYFDGSAGSVTAKEFLDFLLEEVVGKEEFAEYFTGDLSDKLELFRNFADPEELKQARSADWYAELLGMDPEEIRGLFVLYYQDHGGAETGTMTLKEFADFLIQDVAENDQFSGLMEPEFLEQLNNLKTFSDPETVIQERTSGELAGLLGMDPEVIDQIFLLYFGGNGAGDGRMTVPELLAFIQEDVMDSAQFAAYFDTAAREQIQTAALLTDKNTIRTPLDAKELAELLGMDQGLVGQLFYLYFSKNGETESWTMTLPLFLNLITEQVLPDPAYAPYFDENTAAGLQTMNGLAAAASSGKTFTQPELAGLLGMSPDLVGQILYLYYTAAGQTAGWTAALPDFVDFIVTDLSKSPAYAAYFDEQTLAGLNSLHTVFGMALSGESYGAEELAAAAGVDAQTVSQVFAAASAGGTPVTAMTLPEFSELILTNYSMGLSDTEKSGLTLIRAASSGKQYSAEEISELLGTDAYLTAQILYLYQDKNGATAGWVMTLPEFLGFVCDHVAANEEFELYFDEQTLAELTAARALAEAAEAGTAFTAVQMAELLGTDPSLAEQVYYMAYQASGAAADWKLSFYDFVSFLANEVASDPAYSQYLDEDSLTQVRSLYALTDASVKGMRYSSEQMAKLLGMDPDMLKLLYAYRESQTGGAGEWRLSLNQLLDYIMDELTGNPVFSSYLDEDLTSELSLARAAADGAAQNRRYDPKGIAELFGTDEESMDSLFLYYESLYGENGNWKITIPEFVDLLAEVAEGTGEYAGYSDLLDEEMKQQISVLASVVKGAQDGKAYSASEFAELLSGISEGLAADELELLYLYYFSVQKADPERTLSIYEFIQYVTDTILPDERFAPYFDEAAKADLLDAKGQLTDGLSQLAGAQYSRYLINTSFKRESEEAYRFIDDLDAYLDGRVKESYILGDSAVANEMQKTFSGQMNFITLLTVIAIFIVVVVTFRSLVVPAVLVLLIQCAIFMTMGITYIQGVGIYYLAMIIVQAILMGATIDYAILFTSYYRTLRETETIPDALKHSYHGSINTILTSSLILVGVTLAVGLITSDPTTAQVVLTISKGSAIAVLLVIFILPGVLAALDRFVCRKRKK